MDAIVAALFSAAFFGITPIFMRLAVRRVNPTLGSFLTVLVGLPLTFAFAAAAGDIGQVTRIESYPLLLLGVAGILHFTFSRIAGGNAVKMIGATRTQAIEESSVLHSVGLGILLLGEVLTPVELAGVLLMMVGLLVMALSGKEFVKVFDLPQKVFIGGVALSLLAALIRGTTPLMVRVALLTGISALSGNFVSYAFATVTYASLLYSAGLQKGFTKMNRMSVKYLLLAGLSLTMAQTFRYLALSSGPVSIVVPVQKLSPIVTLILSFVVIRQLERINLKLVSGVLILLIGTLALLS